LDLYFLGINSYFYQGYTYIAHTQKKICLIVFVIRRNVSQAPNHHIRILSGGSRDSED